MGSICDPLAFRPLVLSSMSVMIVPVATMASIRVSVITVAWVAIVAITVAMIIAYNPDAS